MLGKRSTPSCGNEAAPATTSAMTIIKAKTGRRTQISASQYTGGASGRRQPPCVGGGKSAVRALARAGGGHMHVMQNDQCKMQKSKCPGIAPLLHFAFCILPCSFCISPV